MTEINSSFSRRLPELQLGIDSTSLGAFKQCPRKYYYSIVLGLEPRQQSVHLRFGLAVHRAVETYERRRSLDWDHEDALRAAVVETMVSTWESGLGRGWVSDHPTKHRLSLIRTIVWYLDDLAKDDQTETVQLASGTPAVELSFRFDSGHKMPATGEAVVLCGHLDKIVDFAGARWIMDVKTTGQTIGLGFFRQFTPGNQFTIYALAGRVAFGAPVRGVLVDGIQVASGFSRRLRGLAERPTAVLDEWLDGLGFWLASMSDCAEASAWPQNDKACDMFGGCQFREVCGRAPGSSRELALRSDFVKRVWDPLVARGDV